MVVGCSAHVVDIAGPQAFLTSCSASKVEFDFAQKMILELVHSGRREKNRRIPCWHQNIARLPMMPFGLKERSDIFRVTRPFSLFRCLENGIAKWKGGSLLVPDRPL